jgi:hypothetical protein
MAIVSECEHWPILNTEVLVAPWSRASIVVWRPGVVHAGLVGMLILVLAKMRLQHHTGASTLFPASHTFAHGRCVQLPLAVLNSSGQFYGCAVKQC